MKQTAFRLDAEDFEIMEAVKRETGLATWASVVRYLLRQYAQQRGIAGYGPAIRATRARKAPKRKK